MNALRIWFPLFRPWSYAATLVPFLVAAAVFGAFRGGDTFRWFAGLAAGLLLQAAANLLNTWGDEKSGVDSAPGAIRTTPQVSQGLVSLRAVFVAAAACVALAFVMGAFLCFRTEQLPSGAVAIRLNTALFAAGAIGLLGATNYSTGVKFKYHGLGVPFVSFLMGPLEMFAAASLLNPDFAAECILDLRRLAVFALWSLPVASLVGVIMHGNDMRDIPSDRAAGITTLALRLGTRGALAYYCVCHSIPYVVCALLFAMTRSAAALMPLMSLPLTARTLVTAVRIYRENPICPGWRRLERASGGIHLVFGALYAFSFTLIPSFPLFP